MTIFRTSWRAAGVDFHASSLVRLRLDHKATCRVSADVMGPHTARRRSISVILASPLFSRGRSLASAIAVLPALIPGFALFVLFAWSVIMIFGIIDVYFPDKSTYATRCFYGADHFTRRNWWFPLRRRHRHNPLTPRLAFARSIVNMQLPPRELAVAVTTTLCLCDRLHDDSQNGRYLILYLNGIRLMSIQLKNINLEFRVRRCQDELQQFVLTVLFRRDTNHLLISMPAT